MTVDPDAEDPLTLYDTKWKQFEQDQWRIEERRGRINKPRLEWLIFSAIRAETGKEGDLGRLYVDFKDYGRSGSPPKTASQQLDMLDLYGRHYLELIRGNGGMSIAWFGRRLDRKSTRLNSSHSCASRMPS